MRMFLLIVNTFGSSRRGIITAAYHDVDHAYVLSNPRIWKLLTVKRIIE